MAKNTTNIAEIPSNGTEGKPIEGSVIEQPKAETPKVNPVIEAMARQQESNAKAIAEGKEKAETPNLPNSTNVSETQKRAEDILSLYKPSHSLIDAAGDARETIKIAATAQNELDGTIQARLARDLADAGYALIKDTKLSPSKDMPKALLKAMQEHNALLGAVSQEKDDTNLVTTYRSAREDETGDEEGLIEQSSANIIDVVSPYGGDKKTQSNIMPAAIKACLLLIGHESRVQYGYIRKSECSGKRFTRNMAFLRRDQINEAEMDSYFEAICVPNNVVAPHKCMVSLDGDNVFTLVPRAASTNVTLRYLVDDWAFALSQHHFNDVALAFDMGPTKSKHPTGLLLRAPKMEREVRTNEQGEFAPRDYAEFTKGNDKEKEAFFKKQSDLIKETRLAAMGDPSTEHFATFLANLDDMAKAKATVLPETAIVNMLRLCKHVMGRFINERYHGKQLPTPLVRELTPLLNEVTSYVKYDDNNGTWLWVNERDETVQALTYRNDAKAA